MQDLFTIINPDSDNEDAESEDLPPIKPWDMPDWEQTLHRFPSLSELQILLAKGDFDIKNSADETQWTVFVQRITNCSPSIQSVLLRYTMFGMGMSAMRTHEFIKIVLPNQMTAWQMK